MIETNSTAAIQESPIQVEDINIFLVSVAKCIPNDSEFYCYYVAFIILLGYALNNFIFPLTLYRMHQLKSKFRNQYNVSFLWMCALLLSSAIDILEYVVAGDGQVYSIVIVVFLLWYFMTCLTTIVCYFQSYAVDGTRYRNVMTLLITLLFFLATALARQWSQWSLEKRVKPRLSHGHFMFYFVVYATIGGAQVNI
jgi:hypothetical protein